MLQMMLYNMLCNLLYNHSEILYNTKGVIQHLCTLYNTYLYITYHYYYVTLTCVT
jgi:hypothetical protein